MMKLFYLFILVSILFSTQTVFAVFPTGVFNDCNITVTLRVGSRGNEVKCLQSKIGVIADGRFGRLTKVAVMDFQSNNRLKADGVVGPLSRLALNALNVSLNVSTPDLLKDDVNPVPLVINNNQKQSESSKENTNNAKDTKNSKDINPNLIYMDKFIETVVKVNRKMGSSEKELQVIAGALRKEILSNNIDYKKQFEEVIIRENKLSAKSNTNPFLIALDKIIGKAFSFFGINPPIARAGIGLPFGGDLFFAFYCAYNNTWMIDITPFPPIEIAVLSYIEGTQGFLGYNLPFTTSLLGTFITPGFCMIPGYPVIVIPTEGIITPIVGSAPV